MTQPEGKNGVFPIRREPQPLELATIALLIPNAHVLETSWTYISVVTQFSTLSTCLWRCSPGGTAEGISHLPRLSAIDGNRLNPQTGTIGSIGSFGEALQTAATEAMAPSWLAALRADVSRGWNRTDAFSHQDTAV